MSEIYVELLDEGVDVWAPVQATRVREDVYELPTSAPQDERWAFKPGSLVRCELLSTDGEEVLRAVSLAE